MIIDLNVLDQAEVKGLIDLKIADLEKKKAETQQRRQELSSVRGLTPEELAALVSAKQSVVDAIDAKIAELVATKAKI